MMKSDYDVERAPAAIKDAMRDRCEEGGHAWRNCCSVIFRVYQRCKWCGEER